MINENLCPLCDGFSIPQARKMGAYQLYFCPSCDLRFTPGAFKFIPDYTEAYFTEAYIQNQILPLKKARNFSDVSTCATYLSFIRAFKNSPKGLSLLDVGCGTGIFCHTGKSMGFDVTGIDISKTAIEIGNKYANGFKLRNLTIDEVISQGKRYDIVVSFEVLEHLSEPLVFVKKIKQVMKKGGKAFFTVPNWDCSLVKEAKNYDALPPYHVLFFTRVALYNLLKIAGYNSIRVNVIKTDPFPDKMRKLIFWLSRRMILRKRYELGLYAIGVSD